MAIHFKWFHNITNNLQSLCGWLVVWLNVVLYRYTFFGPIQLLYALYVRSYVRMCVYFVFVQFFFALSSSSSSLGTLYLWTLSSIFFSLSVLIALWTFLARHDSVYRWAHDQLHILYVRHWNHTHWNVVVVVLVFGDDYAADADAGAAVDAWNC